jgi:hypothetical protein
MSNTITLAIVGVLIAGAVLYHGQNGRYQLVAHETGMLRLDTRTGVTWTSRCLNFRVIEEPPVECDEWHPTAAK